MTQTIENQYEDSGYQDYLVIRHPNGETDKFLSPAHEGAVLRIGRELDNDIILNDPRASRYHTEVRRTAMGELEVRDLGSANSTFIDSEQLTEHVWMPITAEQTVQMAETKMVWEPAVSSQPTVAMRPTKKPAREETSVSQQPPPVAPPPQKQSSDSSTPLMIAIGLGIILLLFIIGGILLMLNSDGDTDVATDPQLTTTAPAAGGDSDSETEPTSRATRSGNLSQQAVGSAPTNTPTPSGPQLAIPVVEIVSTEIRPILLGALPDPSKGIFVVNTRVQNVGNKSFVVSTDDFTLRSRDGAEEFEEAGGNTSEEGLKRLGVLNRFDDLNLTPGGSVNESLLFELPADRYNFELIFSPEDTDPIILGMGMVDVETELAIALGEPTPEPTPTEELIAEADATATSTPTPTPEPTPTATRPALIPAPNVVPQSALAGTIAYPVFNGNTFDLYLGDVASGESTFYRDGASQPAFSPDGSRIAFRSWRNDSLGLVTMDLGGGNGALVATFVEDLLPTWTADGQDVVFLSRRTGDRKSQLYQANAATERGEARLLGEGEYPTIGQTGQLIFKGWGQTAFGLRIGTDEMSDLQSVTNSDQDTAPALSPDGSQALFMSQREGQWDVYRINIDGSGLTRLTEDEAADGLPTWSPDGEAIAFISNRGGPWAIWVMTPDGDGKSQILTMAGTPDGFVGENRDASRGWAEERISWTE